MNEGRMRRYAWLVLAACLALAPVAFAQNPSQGQQQPKPAPQTPPTVPAPAGQAAPGTTPAPAEAPKVDPQEEAAFKAFYDLKGDDPDKQIQLGEQFLEKYPESRYRETVYSRLVNAYFGKREMDKMFAAGEKALQLNPDDVMVLVLMGWVIPHNYDPNDLDAERRLDRAEQYSKHALELLTAMPKPANLTDEQFASTKEAAISQAHSGLGLVYFRRGQFAESVAEFQQATQLTSASDPTDFFVMGIDLQSLKRYAEAVQAFEKCTQTPGPLQPRCKQYQEQAKKLAATQAAPAKP